MAKIRVLVVDDSLVARGVLIEGLKRHPNIEVVGFAINALDAKQKKQAGSGGVWGWLVGTPPDDDDSESS